MKRTAAVQLTAYPIIALAFVLALAFAPSPANANVNRQAEALVRLSPADQTIQVGDTATVEVWVDNVQGFYGFEIELGFDPAIVRAEQVIEGAAFTAYPDEYMVGQSEITSSTVAFAATLLRVPKAGPLNGTLHLATITFRGLSEGTSPLVCNRLALADGNADPIPCTCQGAQIVVSRSESNTFPVGKLLKGVAVDLVRGLVYVADQGDNSVAVVDGASYAVLRQVPSGGDLPNGLALTEDNKWLFVVNSGSNQVAVLDIDNNYAIVRTIGVGRNPFGVAIASGIAYVTNFDDKTTTLIDVHSQSVINTVGVGWHAALPAATGDHAYVPNHSAYLGWRNKAPADELDYVKQHRGSDTGLSIVYADGHVVAALQDYIGFFAAAVDAVHGRVYITKRDGTAEGLYVLDMASNGLLEFVPLLRPYAVAVNPRTQHVFVVHAELDEVIVLDATQGYRLIRVVDTDPNNGAIAGMHGGQGIGVLGNLVFVSNYASGTLTVFDDATHVHDFAAPIDVEYIRGWQESGGADSPLGAPVAPSFAYWYSEQQFERGSMHWRQTPTGPDQVYVFDNESAMTGGTDWMGRDDGIWAQYDDGWHTGMDPLSCSQAWWPYGPFMGLGKVWCEQQTVRTRIGYPIGQEYGTVGGDQAFANGRVFWNPASDAYYVLRYDNHRWQYYRAHRRYEAVIEPNVIGRVALQGRGDSLKAAGAGGNNRGVILTSPSGEHTAANQDGSFSLHTIGQVELTIHYPGYLDAIVAIKADADTDLDLGQITLLGGDVNGDNRIDILDLSYVGYHFGATQPSGAAKMGADLNEDGIVDILDLSIVGGNFGRTGPALWEH